MFEFSGFRYVALCITTQGCVSTENFTIHQTADFDYDCDVDFADFGTFARHWLEDGCDEPDWCGRADLTKDQPNGIVDTFDLFKFAQHWLEGK